MNYSYDDMPSNEMRLDYLDNPETVVMGVKDYKYRTHYKSLPAAVREAKCKKPKSEERKRKNRERDRARRKVTHDCSYINGDEGNYE